MEELIRWLQGYVILQLKGACFENLLRICKAHQVYLWKICQTEKGIQLCIYKKDFLLFAQLCKKVSMRFHVLHKRGLPFVLYKIYRKLYFAILVLVIVCVLKETQLHVWAIEIQGNEMLTDDEIMDFVSAKQIKYGMYKKEIDFENMEMEMRDAFPLITWVSVYTEGTKLHIDLKENALGVEEKEKTVSDIVSNLDGTVVSLFVEQGFPMVKVQDEVKTGDVLVSGKIPVYDEEQNVISYQETSPQANIRIQTIENYTDSLERTYLTTQFFDKKDHYYYVEYKKKRYYFNKFLKQSGNYETLCCTRQLAVLEHMYLPIFYGCETQRKVDFQYFAYTDKEMEKLLSDRLEKYILCLREKGVQIIKKNVKIGKNGSAMYLSAEIEVIEDVTW